MVCKHIALIVATNLCIEVSTAYQISPYALRFVTESTKVVAFVSFKDFQSLVVYSSGSSFISVEVAGEFNDFVPKLNASAENELSSTF